MSSEAVYEDMVALAAIALWEYKKTQRPSSHLVRPETISVCYVRNRFKMTA